MALDVRRGALFGSPRLLQQQLERTFTGLRLRLGPLQDGTIIFAFSHHRPRTHGKAEIPAHDEEVIAII